MCIRDRLPIGAGLEDLGKGLRSQVGTMYGTLKKGPRYLEMAEGYVTGIALDEEDQIIGYQFVNLGKMTDFIKKGDDPTTAYEKAKGQYGRVDDAVKIIDVYKRQAPVYPQVKWMHEHGIDVDVIVGSKTKDLLILTEEMEKAAGNLYITTDDGSFGIKGMVTGVIEDLVEKQGRKYDVCVAIGPMIMMKFVCLLTKKLEIPTIVSLNPIMVDGTGMCGACRVTVGDQVKFACVDGPEFDGHLVNFDEAMERQRIYKTQEGRAMLRLKEGDTHHGGCGQCGGCLLYTSRCV